MVTSPLLSVQVLCDVVSAVCPVPITDGALTGVAGPLVERAEWHDLAGLQSARPGTFGTTARRATLPVAIPLRRVIVAPHRRPCGSRARHVFRPES